MKKKQYLVPQMAVFEVAASHPLAASGGTETLKKGSVETPDAEKPVQDNNGFYWGE